MVIAQVIVGSIFVRKKIDQLQLVVLKCLTASENKAKAAPNIAGKKIVTKSDLIKSIFEIVLV
jgi:hypothetical protein